VFRGTEAATYAAVFAVSGLAFWVAYRSVNIPAFTDFLIGVEAEMRKVTWPTRTELIAGSSVVLFVVVSLAVMMFGFDFLWTAIFTWLGVR
jgi:preprotein translocase subunit SecE